MGSHDSTHLGDGQAPRPPQGAPPPANYAQPFAQSPPPLPPKPQPTVPPVASSPWPVPPPPPAAPPVHPQSTPPVYGTVVPSQPVRAVPVQPQPVQTVQPQPVRPAQPQPVRPQPVQSAQPAQPQPVAPAPVGEKPTPATNTAGVTPQPAVGAGGKLRPILATQPALPRTDLENEEEPEPLLAYLRKSPPWLVSGIVHMALLVILGLWMFAVKEDPRVELEVVMADSEGDQLEEFTFSTPPDDLASLDQMLTPEELLEVPDPFAAPLETEIAIDPTRSTPPIEAPTIGLALTGREKGRKQALLAAYGGDETTENAVAEGLSWLARHQQRDGSWSLSGPYPGGAVNENKAAATAMALLAFQGAGHTHLEGVYAQHVARGWNWLLKQQDADGNFFHSGPPDHRLYTQAQCTIALCELYGMTKDKKFREPAEKAIAYAVRVQDPQHGGWRYVPGSGSDTSVTGWFVMALQSARMAYLPVPEKSLERVRGYLDSVQVNDGAQYKYQPNTYVRPGIDLDLAMSAEGLLCRQYLGWKQDDARLLEGVAFLNANPINWNSRNSYYWYYATQVCHHMEGSAWREWNRVMKEVIPKHQSKRGNERGSWDPNGDQWGGHGGRLYVTCLHLYMLEVYYRHLPIYSYRAFSGE